jgi:S-formylglutathione hydrolase FrmB
MAVSRLSQQSLQQAFPKGNTFWDGTTATSAFDSLGSVTLASATNTITFTNIPQTYTHLHIRASLQANGPGASSYGDFAYFNSDSTESYQRHGLFGDGSGYLQHKKIDYEKWIVEDVIALTKESYRETSSKSPIFIAGLSMGGYGALRLGAKYPNVFKAFSGLSSVTMYKSLAQFLEHKEELDQQVIKPEDVLEILVQNKESLAPFRFDCGENDSLFDDNLALHHKLLENQIPHQFHKYAGEHSWEYWKTNIRETLLFFGAMI